MLYPCMPHAHPPVYKLRKLQAANRLSILTVKTSRTYNTCLCRNETNLIQIDLTNYDSLASGWDCGIEDSWPNRAPRADHDTKTLVWLRKTARDKKTMQLFQIWWRCETLCSLRWGGGCHSPSHYVCYCSSASSAFLALFNRVLVWGKEHSMHSVGVYQLS
jgi:hypothetical protein